MADKKLEEIELDEQLAQCYEDIKVFWAKHIIEYGYSLTAILDTTVFGITPSLRFVDASDDQMLAAETILKDLKKSREKKSDSPKKKSKKNLKGLGA